MATPDPSRVDDISLYCPPCQRITRQFWVRAETTYHPVPGTGTADFCLRCSQCLVLLTLAGRYSRPYSAPPPLVLTSEIEDNPLLKPGCDLFRGIEAILDKGEEPLNELEREALIERTDKWNKLIDRLYGINRQAQPVIPEGSET